MAAPRKPTAVLQLNGAFAHDPRRRRVDPKPKGPIGNAPKQGPLTVAQAWKYIVHCAPEGTLFSRDRLYVEMAASLFAQFRADPVRFHPAKLARLEMMLSKLGMSPADASRVRAAPSRVRGDFDEC